MITTRPKPREPQRVARLGFDDGWLLLPPTFLNLRAPVVVVDRAYVGDPRSFGLEPFGVRDPRVPLPMTDLLINSRGDVIVIRRRSTSEIITSACLHRDRGMPRPKTSTSAVLIIGSTYELESTWAALWSMAIGKAHLRTEPRKKITNQEESNEYA